MSLFISLISIAQCQLCNIVNWNKSVGSFHIQQATEKKTDGNDFSLLLSLARLELVTKK